MNVLGLILARGGSKSIPKKSIAPCAGKPLLAYTVEAARHAPAISRLIISTDDPEIARVAHELGVEVPFDRPAELAQDDTPDFPVFVHALETLRDREQYVPDIIVHFRPTTPLKAAADIERGIQLLIDNPDADSVRSVCPPLHTPFKMYREEPGSRFLIPLLRDEFPELFAAYPEAYNLPRQMLPPVWRHSGYVDVIRTPTVTNLHSMSGTRILPLPFDAWRDIDIDSPRELHWAEEMITDLRRQGREPWQ